MKKPSPSSQGGEPAGMASEWHTLVEHAQREGEAQQAAEQAAKASLGRMTDPAWRRYVVMGVLSLLLVMAGALFSWQRLWAPPAPSEADLDRGRRALLALVSSSLADHVRMHGDYPESIGEVLPLQVDVAYRKTLDGYELSVRLANGQVLTEKKP